MSAIRLGIGRERKTLILVVGIARKPMLLFRHRRGVRPEKCKPIESGVELVIIQFSRLRLVDNLPRFLRNAAVQERIRGGLSYSVTASGAMRRPCMPCLMISVARSYCPCAANTALK